MTVDYYIGVDECMYESSGSYIVVEPYGKDEETCRGKVAFNNPYKKYKINDFVFYHEKDSTEIIINAEKYHIIKWYDIILKQLFQEDEDKKDMENKKLKFLGLSADF